PPLLPGFSGFRECSNLPPLSCPRGEGMRAPTRFLQDILRQPMEMHRTVEFLTGPGQDALERASALIRSAEHIFLTGIGASWNAALSAGALFDLVARPTYMREAG